MGSSESTGNSAKRLAGEFPATQWGLVQSAGCPESTISRAALEELCRAYWYPLYGFVRRQGYGAEDAQDLTQEFFARFLGRERFRLADPERGRFRTFLLASLRHFLVSEWRKGQALRRNGGTLLSLDAAWAEQRYQVEASDPLSPDKIFEKRWAEILLGQVMSRLREGYRIQGQGRLFEELLPTLTGDSDALPYLEIASRLGLTEGAVKVAVHRLRQRYREVLRAEVTHTLANPADADEELRHLLQVMAG